MPLLTRLAPFTHEVPVHLHRPDGGGDGSLLVALHGMGQSAEFFAKEALPCAPAGASVLIPQAPLPLELRGAAGIRQGNGWYIYNTGETETFLASMRQAEDWVLRQVEFVVADHGFDGKRVSLLGFSQGGYLAGWMGVRHAARFRRLVVAGGRVKHEKLEDDARRAAATPLRVLAVHGSRDEGVKPDAARTSVEALAALGVPAEFRVYDCGHPVLREERCREDVKAFLAS
jgi:phospholipase/carboxylesterase